MWIGTAAAPVQVATDGVLAGPPGVGRGGSGAAGDGWRDEDLSTAPLGTAAIASSSDRAECVGW